MSTQIRLTGFKKKLAMVVAIAAILLFWQIAAWSLPDFLMPGLPSVMVRLWEDIHSADFRAALSGARLSPSAACAILPDRGFYRTLTPFSFPHCRPPPLPLP